MSLLLTENDKADNPSALSFSAVVKDPSYGYYA